MKAAQPYVWLAIALCIGAIAIFWRLTEPSLFLDEAFTLSVGAMPLAQLLAFVAGSDYHPPLSYLITHALLGLHLAAWDYRWFVAPFGLLTIAAAWGIAQSLFGSRAAAVAALLTATSPLLVDWDRMYRSYAPFVALSALSWWLLLALSSTQQQRRPIVLAGLYVISAACLPLLNYVGIALLASQALYALVRPRTRWPVAAAVALAGLALLWWLPGLREQLGRGGSGVLANPVIWEQLALQLFAAYLPSGVAAWQPWVEWLGSALVLGVVLAALWLGRTTALPFLLAPALVQVAASALLGKNFVNPRYLLYIQPFFAVCAGAVASAGRLRAAGFAAAMMLFACNVIGLQNLLFDPYYQRTDWYAIATLLLANEHPDDTIVLDQGYMHYVVDDLNGFRGHPSFRVESSASVQDAGAWLRAQRRHRVWYVENQFYYPDPGREVLGLLQSTRPALGTYQQTRASRGDAAIVVLFGPAR